MQGYKNMNSLQKKKINYMHGAYHCIINIFTLN